MPQVVKGGTVPVIASPTIVPVYFSGDSLQPRLDAAMQTVPGSAGFMTLAEYGVTSATVGTSIVVNETPASATTSVQVQSWITGKLDGTHPEFGPVDAPTLASKVFVIYYPAATMFPSICGGFDAGQVVLPSGAVTNIVVVAECGIPPGDDVADHVMSSAVWGLIAQIAGPDQTVQTSPSDFRLFDQAHLANSHLETINVQLVAGCKLARGTPVSFQPLTFVPLDAGLPEAGAGWDRIGVWSNSAAAAYHDPCVPHVSGPYFVSVPVASDQVTVTVYQGPMSQPVAATTTGVLVQAGGKKTVNVELLSDGPTSGPWTVSTELLDTSGFTFGFDRTTGQNGDVVHLTVTAPGTPQQGTVAIYSTLEGRRTFYVLAVESM
jgi:hypothetical protein